MGSAPRGASSHWTPPPHWAPAGDSGNLCARPALRAPDTPSQPLVLPPPLRKRACRPREAWPATSMGSSAGAGGADESHTGHGSGAPLFPDPTPHSLHCAQRGRGEGAGSAAGTFPVKARRSVQQPRREGPPTPWEGACGKVGTGDDGRRGVAGPRGAGELGGTGVVGGELPAEEGGPGGVPKGRGQPARGTAAPKPLRWTLRP